MYVKDDPWLKYNVHIIAVFLGQDDEKGNMEERDIYRAYFYQCGTLVIFYALGPSCLCKPYVKITICHMVSTIFRHTQTPPEGSCVCTFFLYCSSAAVAN